MAHNLFCLDITPNKNYWFVRTQDGTFFEEFLSGGYIAIGWNKVTPEIIREAKKRNQIQEYISKHFPNENRHGLTVTHMIRFVNEMRIGDIVVIPSKSSENFSFGEITSDVFLETDFEPGRCEFTKRRKVNWLKTVESIAVDKNLQSIKYSETAVSNVNNYTHYIDKELGGFIYTKGGLGNLVIEAGEGGNVKAKDLNNFLTTSLLLIERHCPEIDINDIEIKINLQSKGTLQIIGAVGVIFLLSSIIFLATKNDFSLKVNIFGASIESASNTEGLLNTFSNYKDKELERELKQLQIQQERLKVKIPEAIPALKIQEQNMQDIQVRIE